MATVEFEDTHIVSILQDACHWHRQFKNDYNDIEAVAVAKTYTQIIALLFNVNIRVVPHLMEKVISEMPRTHWGLNLWNELAKEASKNKGE